MTIHELLDHTSSIPSVEGVAVLDLATGMSLGSRGVEEAAAESFAADYARSLTVARRFLEPGADEDRVQELHIQTVKHSIFFLPLNPNKTDGVYLCFLMPPQALSHQTLQEEMQQLRARGLATGDLYDDSSADALYCHLV